MKSLRRSYFRWRESFYRRFRPHQDVVIISYPKAGRTWLRVMLDQLAVFPEWSHAGSHDDLVIEAEHLESFKELFRNRNAVLLIRDPRDIVVSSYYQYTRRENKFLGPISEFVRDEVYGIEGILAFYQFWLGNAAIFADVIVVNYEDMVSDTRAEISRILDFAGKSGPSKEKIRRVVEGAHFDQMKLKEASGAYAARYPSRLTPGDVNDTESYKVRKGKVGGYADYLDDEDIRYCNEIIAKTNPREIFCRKPTPSWTHAFV